MPYSALAAHQVGTQDSLESPSLWLPPEATMIEAATVMSQVSHRPILVVRQLEGHQREYLGILTEQEILLAVSQGLDMAQTPVSHCMVPYESHRPQPHSTQLRWETYLAPLLQIHQELAQLRYQNRLQVFHRILAHLGQAMRAARIYLFEAYGETQGQPQFSQRVAWYAEDMQPAIPNGTSGNGTSGNGTSGNGTSGNGASGNGASGNGASVNTVYLDCLPEWHGTLAQGKAIAGKVSELPDAPRQILEAQGIGSILVFPLKTGQSARPLAPHPFYGFIGVEDLAQGRGWDNGEMLLLEMVAASLSLVYEHQQIQQALSQTQTAFSSVFQCSPDPISIATFPEGRYLAVNASFEALVGGMPQSAILERTPAELGLIANRRQIVRLIRQLQKKGSVASQEVEYRQGRHGAVSTLLVSCELIEFAGRACVLAVGKDITDRKHMEDALRNLVA